MSATRAALVTGSAQGIGLAIARMLGEEGHAVTLTDRQADALEHAAGALRDAGVEVHTVTGDIGDEETIVRVVAEHRERFGRLDVLVNNAGVAMAAPLAEITTKRLDIQLGVNLRATILFYRECIELLRQAGAEHRNAVVVNLASISAKSGVARMGVYSAAKAGVVAFTEAMNKELADWGIKSTALCPGPVDTPMTDVVTDSKGHMMRPEDISEAVRFLLRTSPQCVVPEILFLLPGQAPSDST